MSGQTSWIGTRVARHPATRVFPRATQIAGASALLGTIDRWFAIAPRAWQQSLLKQRLDRATGPLETWQRFRLIGWGVIVAAMTHAMVDVTPLMESRVAQAAWVLVAGAGGILVAACRPMAAAWRNRR